MRPLILLAVLSGCAAVQKVEPGEVNCAASAVAADLPGAVTQAIGALTGSSSNAALDQLLVADGLSLAYCAVQAAVSALENGGAVAPLSPMVRSGAVASPQDNVVAIARGEAWLAVHSR